MTQPSTEIDAVQARALALCAAHQDQSPTRQPCAACSHEASAESDQTAVAVERLTEAVGSSKSDVADAAAVLVNVGDVRRALRALDDLRSRLGCVVEATYWDRPYDTRLDAIRGMCDLATNGLTPASELAITPGRCCEYAPPSGPCPAHDGPTTSPGRVAD